MFIGRDADLAYLNSCYHSETPSFVILHGRRRIGKTELLRNFIKGRSYLFYTARPCMDRDQLSSFCKRSADDLKLSTPLPSSSWDSAFSALCDSLPSERKNIIILDEFTHIASNSKDFYDSLYVAWEAGFKDKNVLFILCASDNSELRSVTAQETPLTACITSTYRVSELERSCLKSFFPSYSLKDQLTVWSITGGIPHYLRCFAHDKPVSENIKNCVLASGAPLHDEVEYLMRQELRETSKYSAIMQAIAHGKTRVFEIAEYTSIAPAKLSVYVKSLLEMDILQKEYPLIPNMNEQAQIQSVRYGFKDYLFRFYYRFVFCNLSEIEAHGVDAAYNMQVAPFLHTYIRRSFIEVCENFLRKDLAKRPLMAADKSGRYWQRDAEIDIVVYDSEDNLIAAAECQCDKTPFPYDTYERLSRNLDELNVDRSRFPIYLFSLGGFSKLLSDEAGKDQNLRLIGI